MKRQRPSAWEIAKFASKNRTPYSKGGKGWGVKHPKVVPGFTRTAGPYARAYKANPSRALTMGAPPEKKYLDTTATAVNAPTTGVIQAVFTVIPQGTTEITRVGGKITVTNFNVRGNFSLTTTALSGTPNNDVVRMILFIDKQTNGAAPAVTDILKSANGQAYMNLDNVDRFQILKDKMIKVGFTASGSTNLVGDLVPWKINKKMNLPIHYSSTTGAITEVKSNNIYMLFTSWQGVVNFNYYARVKFTDA